MTPSQLPSRRPAGRFTALTCSVLCTLLLWGCDTRRLAESVFVGKQFSLEADKPYDSGARHTLDVYRPRERSNSPLPVIVFLYGGRWQSGAKNAYRLAGDAITRGGYIGVIPDYRLAPAVKFPAWIEDAARAIRWVHDSITSYGGDTTRVFVVGHSAGAHTATVLALDDRFLLRAGVQPEAIRGYVSLAGPVDTVWTDPDVQALMGPKAGWPGTYPAELVSSTRHRPLLLLHGAKDETVRPANSTNLAARMRTFGNCARADIYPSLTHTSIVVAFMIPRLPIAPVMNDIETFMRDPAAVCPPPTASLPPTNP